MKIAQTFFGLLAMFALAACSAPGAGPAAPTLIAAPTTVIQPTSHPPTPLPPTATLLPPTATSLPTLSEQQLKNATYRMPFYDETVTLQDGKYQSGDKANFLYLALLPQIAYGDLNGDGLEDAAILLAENGGGSGVFVSLVAILNQGGQPIQSGAVLVDDRPQVNSLEIQQGKITLDAVIHGPNDPMVSPTLPVKETFQLEENTLHLVRFASKTPSGAEHTIFIDSPLWNEQVGEVVQVRGSMPIGPFENNLACRFYDATGNELYAGPFGVSAADMGAPATFDNPVKIPLSPAGTPLPSGTVIWLELGELSMADGSPMAIARVRLVVR